MLETTNQVGVYCHSQDFQFDFLIITYITGIKGESRVVSMVLSIKHGVQTYVPWSKDGINGLNMVLGKQSLTKAIYIHMVNVNSRIQQMEVR
jgi:hypothetical protein